MAIRENEFSNSRERITNLWERIAQFDITIHTYGFCWKSTCPFRAFVYLYSEVNVKKSSVSITEKVKILILYKTYRTGFSNFGKRPAIRVYTDDLEITLEHIFWKDEKQNMWHLGLPFSICCPCKLQPIPINTLIGPRTSNFLPKNWASSYQ